MTNGLRWRILVLQVGLIGILAFVSGFAFWASNFATSTVHDQLAAQQIYFPTAGSAALTALPRTDDTAMTQYAGQQLLTGQQAEVYANNFINVHLGEIGGGKTYSQLSAEAMAAPTNAKLAAQVDTIFKGTTLRSMLLNAYGWSQIGLFAGYAAIGLLVAAIVVLGAFLFEIVRWRATVTATRTIPPCAGGGPAARVRTTRLLGPSCDPPALRGRWVSRYVGSLPTDGGASLRPFEPCDVMSAGRRRLVHRLAARLITTTSAMPATTPSHACEKTARPSRPVAAYTADHRSAAAISAMTYRVHGYPPTAAARRTGVCPPGTNRERTSVRTA